MTAIGAISADHCPFRVQFCANRVVTRYSRSIAATWSRRRMRAYIFIALSRL